MRHSSAVTHAMATPAAASARGTANGMFGSLGRAYPASSRECQCRAAYIKVSGWFASWLPATTNPRTRMEESTTGAPLAPGLTTARICSRFVTRPMGSTFS